MKQILSPKTNCFYEVICLYLREHKIHHYGHLSRPLQSCKIYLFFFILEGSTKIAHHVLFSYNFEYFEVICTSLEVSAKLLIYGIQFQNNIITF